jgi:hypothetical protein
MNDGGWRKPYTAWRLRSIRSVLAPNGSSSNAPAIIVVGSGTAVGSKSYLNLLPGCEGLTQRRRDSQSFAESFFLCVSPRSSAPLR